jgi:carbonic anhydrase
MPEFVTCLNCMDGRVQQPMTKWLQENYQAKHVDMITEAGMDGYIADHHSLPDSLKYKIDISIIKHGSNDIFIVGHHDCGGHPVEEDIHHEHILAAVDKLKELYPDCSVTGVWISDSWEAEKLIEK